MSNETDMPRHLQTMPGVDPTTALAVETFAPPMGQFRRGPDFAAWRGPSRGNIRRPEGEWRRTRLTCARVKIHTIGNFRPAVTPLERMPHFGAPVACAKGP